MAGSCSPCCRCGDPTPPAGAIKVLPNLIQSPPGRKLTFKEAQRWSDRRRETGPQRGGKTSTVTSHLHSTDTRTRTEGRRRRSGLHYRKKEKQTFPLRHKSALQTCSKKQRRRSGSRGSLCVRLSGERRLNKRSPFTQQQQRPS